jgi:hypothetical protein
MVWMALGDRGFIHLFSPDLEIPLCGAMAEKRFGWSESKVTKNHIKCPWCARVERSKERLEKERSQ